MLRYRQDAVAYTGTTRQCERCTNTAYLRPSTNTMWYPCAVLNGWENDPTYWID